MTTSEKTANFDQSEPVPLDPIILSARDELLEKYSDKSFEDQITYFKAVIEGERDSVTRLSAMAARVYILRKRLAMLAGNLMEDQLNDLSSKHNDFDIDTSLSQTSDAKEPQGVGNDKSWMRLRIVDSSEVNGVRFPAGVVIDVKREDGEKLIESGKADFISTEESRHFKSEEGLDDAIQETVVKDEPAETESAEEVAAEDVAAETESTEEVAVEDEPAETESAEEVVAEDAATETESAEEVAAEDAAVKLEVKEKS